MKRAPLVLLLGLATACTSQPPGVDVGREKAIAGEREKHEEEMRERFAKRRDLDDTAKARAERAKDLEKTFDLDGQLAAVLAARPTGPDLLQAPFPKLYRKLRDKLPLSPGLTQEDIRPFEDLGALDEDARQARLDRLLAPAPLALAVDLARLYGYTFRLADEASLLLLAGSPEAARLTGKAAREAFLVSTGGVRETRRFPLEATIPLDRLAALPIERVRESARRLTVAGLELGSIQLDPRALDVIASLAGNDAGLAAAEAVAAQPPSPRLVLARVAPAAFARLGKVDRKKLVSTLEDLAHTQGWRELESMDAAVAETIAALAEADASGILLAVEMSLEAPVRPPVSAQAVAIRKLATPAKVRDALRNAAKSGVRLPEDYTPAMPLEIAELAVKSPQLPTLVSAARATWATYHTDPPSLRAVLPLAARPQVKELLRIAAQVGLAPSAGFVDSMRALADLDAAGGRGVLEAVAVNLPLVRLTSGEEVRRLAALVKRGLTPPAVIKISDTTAAGPFDDARAAWLAQKAGLAPG